MLNFFKEVFKVNDWRGRHEENLRREVEKLKTQYLKPSRDRSGQIKDCVELFARLNNRTSQSDERYNDGELNELNDDLDDYQIMPNIDKTFKENCSIQLNIANELEGENVIKVGHHHAYIKKKPNQFSGDSGHGAGSGKGNRAQLIDRLYLKDYKVPSKVYKLLEAQEGENDSNITIGLNLDEDLTHVNYVMRFNNLLWIEEAYLTIEMRRYDMKDVKLKQRRPDCYSIEVPGLSEGRPSLMAGDTLVLKSKKRPKGYEGIITEIQLNQIMFKLNEQMRIGSCDELLFDVYFKSSRAAYRRLHHGVSLFDTKPLIKYIIFPKRDWLDKELYYSLKAKSIKIKEQSSSDVGWKCTNLNTQQKQAVINILKGSCRPNPYIVYGPPGTGKTMTLVEAILQTHCYKPQCNILVCVNSNSGVDIIAKRVLTIGKLKHEKLIRFSALSRDPSRELKCITKDLESLTKVMLRKSRIIFTTLIQAGALYGNNHEFDFLFIDEAGHATEPETLIPVGLLKTEGLLVLAGDFHQLGPVCFSAAANNNGLGMSLLQRLSERKMYQRKLGTNTSSSESYYNNDYITKLLVCNRSDIRLLNVNNRMFYDNELNSEVKTPTELLNHFGVRKPILFEPIKGREKRERQSPSCCNPIEVVACIRYVYQLYKGGLKPEKLGIIAPYKLQVEKLKHVFAKCRLPICKIASIEEFQGDERLVIIISTVRTTDKTTTKQLKPGLNFLFQKRRFNVATSRAKYMNVLIGDPDILKRDTCWREYIEEAVNMAT